MKTLVYSVQGVIYSSGTTEEITPGTTARLHLDQEFNPNFPAYIDTVLQNPIGRTNCHVNTYSFEYDESLLEGSGVNAIRQCDVTNITTMSCCEVINDKLSQGFLIYPFDTAPVNATLSIILDGSVSPDVDGILSPAEKNAPVSESLARVFGASWWTSDGGSTPPASGEWAVVRPVWMKASEAISVDEAFAKDDHASTGSQSTASFVSVLTLPGTFRSYWLFYNNGSPKWVRSDDATLADAGSEQIDPGDFVYSQPRKAGYNTGQFISEPFASLAQQSPTEFYYSVSRYTDGVLVSGGWNAVGALPVGLTYDNNGPSTGTLTVSGAEGFGVQTTPPDGKPVRLVNNSLYTFNNLSGTWFKIT